MTSIYDLTARIRDLINSPRKQSLLFKDRNAWLRLCSSLDAIGDTDLALASYLAEPFPSSWGALYLVVYGVLQVLYAQQNAVTGLLSGLSIEVAYKDFPRLSRIRDIRSASIGHPTEKKTKGGHSYHFIARATLQKSGFTLLSHRPDGSMHWEEVVIPDLIAQQRQDVADILGRVIKELETEEERHREEFRRERLQDLLPASLSYDYQKIAEATAGTTTREGAGLGQVSVKMMRQALERLREALTRRGLAEALHLNESIDEILYPLSELDAFFKTIRAGETPRLNERLAYICAFFVDRRIEGLRQTAREIDEEYAEPVRPQERPETE
jgi:hypothetical protein